MFNLMLMIIFLILFSFFLFLMNLFLSKKKIKNREKNSSFECGFDSISDTRIPFSVQFFLISLMFLIFDIEISLLIPLIYTFMNFNFWMIASFLIFMFILILSIYIEYLDNMIEWKI